MTQSNPSQITYRLNESILGGFSEARSFGSPGTYSSAIAVDPDMAINLGTTRTRAGGIITCPAYSKFSGTEIDGDPLWIITHPKKSDSYVYTAAGKLHSFTEGLSMRSSDEASTSLPISITGGAGNGAVYYNNFIYLAEATNISEYGGMDAAASIALTENVWSGSKLGSQALLTDTTYPLIRGTRMPNHVMHHHKKDDSVYVCDVLPTTASTSTQGVIHNFLTKRTTIDGDTDDGSAYNVLALPYGYFPTCIESFGADLVIGAIQATDGDINSGVASLFIWDTLAPTYHFSIPLNEPLVTAMKTKNGRVHVFTGNASGGTTMQVYEGGRTMSEDPHNYAFIEDGVPPLAGAVDITGDRISWGGNIIDPTTAATVWGYGSKTKRMPKALHNIARASSTGANNSVSALKTSFLGTSHVNPRFIIGWADDSANGLDKIDSSGTQKGIFRTEQITPGSSFQFDMVKIMLADAISNGVIITPTIYTEDGATAVLVLATINNTNFANMRKIVYKGSELDSAVGINNFFIELAFTGTVPVSVNLPIEVTVTEIGEESE